MIECQAKIRLEDDSASSSSESTNDVFYAMLGLSAMDSGAISSAVDDENPKSGHHKRSLKQPQVVGYKSSFSLAKNDEHHTKQYISFLEVPQRCSRYLHKPSTVAAFVIDNLITASDCQSMIRLAEELSATGFHYVTEASHTDDDGVTHIVKLQQPNTHKLSVFEHEPTLTKIWDALGPVIEPYIQQFTLDTNSGPPLGLNPRLRVLRYDASDNDVFNPHFDATTRVTTKHGSSTSTSLLTVLIYLNDGGGQDFDGGETHYLDSTNVNSEPTIVVPTAGTAVVFEHDLYHSSVQLKFGTKYVVRTDVLFQINDEEGGVDKPRRENNRDSQRGSNAETLLELCEELSVCDHTKSCLSEMGLIDLTLESLLAPGIMAVKQMLSDVLDKDAADLIVSALMAS